MNGIGERCGNVDLTAVIPNLELKYGRQPFRQPRTPHVGVETSLELLGYDGPLDSLLLGLLPSLTRAVYMSRLCCAIQKPTSTCRQTASVIRKC